MSEFAHTTELEGCEKGQAISDLASSKAADHRQNPESDHNPCDHESDESAMTSRPMSRARIDRAPEASGDESCDQTRHPGQTGDEHGQSGESHGQSGESHGQSGESHGQAGQHGGGHGGDDWTRFTTFSTAPVR